MPDNHPYQVAHLLPDHIRQAAALSGAEGWNQTFRDWEFLVKVAESTCLCTLAGKYVVGTAAAINYSDEVAWIGMVLVDREFRGRGLSQMMLRELFRKIEPVRCLKLDATPAGYPVYLKLGFLDEYIIRRMTTTAISLKNIRLSELSQVFPIEKSDIADIIAFDQRVFGANRSQLIRYLHNAFPQKCGMVRLENRIRGFVLGRSGTRFHHIGPLMADSEEVARLMLADSLIRLEGKPAVVDVPDGGQSWIEFLRSAGFAEQRHFIRMYRYENPFPGLHSEQFLIAGPEFG